MRRGLAIALLALSGMACPSSSAEPVSSSETVVTLTSALQLRPVLKRAFRDDEQWGDLEPVCPESRCPDLDIDSASRVTAEGDDGTRYRLAPAILSGDNVVTARVAPENPRYGRDEWVIIIELDAEGTAAMAEATRRASTAPPPQNAIAILVDGVVVSAPDVTLPIENGSFQISLNASESEAEAYLDRLTA